MFERPLKMFGISDFEKDRYVVLYCPCLEQPLNKCMIIITEYYYHLQNA